MERARSSARQRRDDLYPDGQALRRETAENAQGRQADEIVDGAVEHLAFAAVVAQSGVLGRRHPGYRGREDGIHRGEEPAVAPCQRALELLGADIGGGREREAGLDLEPGHLAETLGLGGDQALVDDAGLGLQDGEQRIGGMVEIGQGDGVNLGAGLLEKGKGGLEVLLDRGLDEAALAGMVHDADLEALQPMEPGREEAAGHALQQPRRIGHPPGQRPGMVEGPGERLDALEIDEAEARLQPHHPAIGGRDADRSARIGADRPEAEARGHPRGGAAAGAA